MKSVKIGIMIIALMIFTATNLFSYTIFAQKTWSYHVPKDIVIKKLISYYKIDNSVKKYDNVAMNAFNDGIQLVFCLKKDKVTYSVTYSFTNDEICWIISKMFPNIEFGGNTIFVIVGDYLLIVENETEQVFELESDSKQQF